MRNANRRISYSPPLFVTVIQYTQLYWEINVRFIYQRKWVDSLPKCVTIF
jgi:hypothetical protein